MQHSVRSDPLSRPAVYGRRHSFPAAQGGRNQRSHRRSGPVRRSDGEPGGDRFTGGHQRGLVQRAAARSVVVVHSLQVRGFNSLGQNVSSSHKSVDFWWCMMKMLGLIEAHKDKLQPRSLDNIILFILLFLVVTLTCY